MRRDRKRSTMDANDKPRIRTQEQRVRLALTLPKYYGRWWTLGELSQILQSMYSDKHFPEASLSARLRDCRRDDWKVECRVRKGCKGLREYQVLLPARIGAQQSLFAQEDAHQ